MHTGLAAFRRRSGLASPRAGFTLIEPLVVIGIIAVLAAIVIIAINPARQFAQARNSQRTSNVTAILNAVGQNLADNKGVWKCPGFDYFTVTGAEISAGSANIRSCLVPTYISELPVDPSNGVAWDGATYDTHYTIATSSEGRFTVCAPGGAEAAVAGSAAICITR